MQRKQRLRRSVAAECYFCKNQKSPDYKEAAVLRRFMTERGKIMSASRTGNCSKHQRALRRAILRARFLALVLYVEKPL